MVPLIISLEGIAIVYLLALYAINKNKAIEKDERKHRLVITGVGGKTFAIRWGSYITIINYGKVEIGGKDFWSLTYINDSMECEVIDAEPFNYTLSYMEKE